MTSPDGEMRVSTPGNGVPTVSSRTSPSFWIEMSPLASVMPYSCFTFTPSARKNTKISGPMASPAVYARRILDKPRLSRRGPVTSARPSGASRRRHGDDGWPESRRRSRSCATSRKNFTMTRLSHVASSIRIITFVRTPSQILGGAKKCVGPISLRSVSTVAALSGQLTAKPITIDWA